MNAVSRVKLVSECDGATLRAALSRFSDIPWLIGEVAPPLIAIQLSPSLCLI